MSGFLGEGGEDRLGGEVVGNRGLTMPAGSFVRGERGGGESGGG